MTKTSVVQATLFGIILYMNRVIAQDMGPNFMSQLWRKTEKSGSHHNIILIAHRERRWDGNLGVPRKIHEGHGVYDMY